MRLIHKISNLEMGNKDEYKKIFSEFDEKNEGFLKQNDAADAIRCCGFNPTTEQIKKAIKGE
jgi:Ca2+-binding EF-hand superfamily protein